MHYLIRADWNRPPERFELDAEFAFARRWLQVCQNVDAGVWMMFDDGSKIGTRDGETRWPRPGLHAGFCRDCSHEFWSRRADDGLCFACAICVRPAVRHRPIRDAWRCDGAGGMEEHSRDERGYCWTCRRPWVDVLARVERSDCGTTISDGAV